MNPYLKRTRVPQHGQKAEKRAAKRLKGHRVPASGALSGAKGDIRLKQFLVESKATRAASITIELAWLDKITQEAMNVGKEPALLVQFVDAQGRPRYSGCWALVPEYLFEALRP